MGRNALISCTTGNHNTAIGGAATLFSLTTGTHNTACGTDALQSTTTGNDNVAVGSNSGSGITSGSENVCLGHDAGATQIRSDRLYIAEEMLLLVILQFGFMEINMVVVIWVVMIRVGIQLRIKD